MQLSLTMIVYNGAAFIEEALQSAYKQTRVPDEIVVWNDGSTDETLTILNRHQDRVRILNSPENQGAMLARRAVVSAAASPYVAFLDADDRLHPEALSSFVVAASKDPGADLIFGRMQNFYDLPATKHLPRGSEWFHARANGNMLAKREAFLSASQHAELTERSEFPSWYQAGKAIRLREVQIDAPVCERRIHESNAGRHPEMKREMMMMLKRHIDQQRGSENR
ncbi:MAG: glycosyltransferase family A protein [Verrucomicrobiales bacterium]